MDNSSSPLIAALLLIASSPALAAAQPVAAAALRAQFRGVGGAELGSAELRPSPAGVLIRLELHGLAPGWHAIHIHEKGDCSDPKFQTAGGHVHATGRTTAHGLLNPAGPETGDLPNIYVSQDGESRAELFTGSASLRAGGSGPALLDSDGSSLVVHEKADDHVSQPIGGAGGRVACAVIGAPVTTVR
jgi:Cu-Zn family superoxide dismutase